MCHVATSTLTPEPKHPPVHPLGTAETTCRFALIAQAPLSRDVRTAQGARWKEGMDTSVEDARPN